MCRKFRQHSNPSVISTILANVKMQHTNTITWSLCGILLVHAAICCQASASETADEAIRIRLHQRRPQKGLVEQLQVCRCLNSANEQTYLRLSNATRHDAPGAKCDREACHLAMRAITFQPYTGRMHLGTPAQEFEFLFDTGSDTIWVPHSKCRLNGEPWDSELRQKFAIDESSTFKRINRDRVQLRYANRMEFDGWWIKDTLRIPDAQDSSRSLTVPDQALALICFIKGRGRHYDDGFDGLIGLSFRTPNSRNSPTLLENMVQKGLLREPVFSFYTSHTSTDGSLSRQRISELVFGQLDSALYTGPITWTPVTKLPFWQIRIHSIKLVSRETDHESGAHDSAPIACKHGCEAAVDTGTSMMVGPAAEVAQLNEMLGFVRHDQMTDFYVTHGPCAMHVNQDMLLVFELSGPQLELEAQQFLFDLDENGVKVCVSSLRAHPSGQERLPWILGAPFISSFYTIFDFGQKRVGFAKPAIVSGWANHNRDEAGPSSRNE